MRNVGSWLFYASSSSRLRICVNTLTSCLQPAIKPFRDRKGPVVQHGPEQLDVRSVQQLFGFEGSSCFSLGSRKFASTAQTGAEIWAARLRLALAQIQLLPLPSSTPQKTTDLGDFSPPTKKRRCTRPRISSRASASKARAEAL